MIKTIILVYIISCYDGVAVSDFDIYYNILR